MIRLSRAAALTAVLCGAAMLQGCLVGAVAGAGAAVVGTGAKVVGGVAGAGIDAVTTSDEETRARRVREERRMAREQRRCDQLRANGRNC